MSLNYIHVNKDGTACAVCEDCDYRSKPMTPAHKAAAALRNHRTANKHRAAVQRAALKR